MCAPPSAPPEGSATVKGGDHQELLAEEALIVRHSGEIPEIAYHGSLYYLEQDPEGPGLRLDDQERQLLQKQAVARYREIILRDLDPANRDRTLYRGLDRAICNWRRLEAFLSRQRLSRPPGLRQEVARALADFLQTETAEVQAGQRSSCVNCHAEQLAAFCRLLGLELEALPAGWPALCRGRVSETP